MTAGYLSLTDRDRDEMLAAIGVSSIDDLFAQIPEEVRFAGDLDVPPALTEVELIRHLEELAAKGKNITAVKAAPDATNLPPECCDSIVVRRVYHHFPNPALMDASLLHSLKPGGLLAVIDFAPREGLPEVKEDVPKDRGGHGIAQKIVTDELTAAGFEVVSHPDDWPNDDYCVIFRKPSP